MTGGKGKCYTLYGCYKSDWFWYGWPCCYPFGIAHATALLCLCPSAAPQFRWCCWLPALVAFFALYAYFTESYVTWRAELENASGDNDWFEDLQGSGEQQLFGSEVKHFYVWLVAIVAMSAWGCVTVYMLRRDCCRASADERPLRNAGGDNCAACIDECCAMTVCSGCAIAGRLGYASKEYRPKANEGRYCGSWCNFWSARGDRARARTGSSAPADAAAGGQSDAALVMAPMLPTLPGGLPGAAEAV